MNKQSIQHGLMWLMALGMLWLTQAEASSVSLEGQSVQGGLLVGQATPGSTVTWGGESLPITRDGFFVFGLPKDAIEARDLNVTLPSGEQWTESIKPEPRTFQVQRIDGLEEAFVTPPESTLARIRTEAQQARAARANISDLTGFTESFIWPVGGRITGVYGSQRILNGEPRSPHWGLDIAAPTGTPVQAPAGGRVVLAHPDMYYSGATLFLDHGHGLISAFLHLDRIDVVEGQLVSQGDRIGRVGSTGRSTGPHLDWRVSWRDVRVDAQLLVPPR